MSELIDVEIHHVNNTMTAAESVDLYFALKKKYPYVVWNCLESGMETYLPNRNTNKYEIVKFNINDNEILITLSDDSGTTVQYLPTDIDSSVNRITEALNCWESRWILN